MSNSISVLTERMIYRLKKEGTVDGFSEIEILKVLDAVRFKLHCIITYAFQACDVLHPEDALVELSTPVIIFGDIHGQFEDLMLYFEKMDIPDDTTLLFLGYDSI